MTKKVGLQNHGERGHALLSASGAHRWMHCTPSAILERDYGEKTTSVYANEGTLAHELAELYLRYDLLKDMPEGDFNNGLEKVMANELFNDEMLTAVPVYTEYCAEQYAEAKANNKFAFIQLEQRLDLSVYVPGSFGTADCVVISDGVMEVIDLKYGKGVPVSAEWNNQLMLYALGALDKYAIAYDITDVRMTIVQPRLDNISSWQVPVEDLVRWAETELVPKAEAAAAGDGELCAGEWCRFCSVKHRCRALYEHQMEIAKHDFAKPELLTDKEIASVVERASEFTNWVNSIVEYAEAKAVDEEKSWPGLKLVEGRSSSKWVDEDTVGDTILDRCKDLNCDQVFVTKLNTITNIKKLVGQKRFTAELSDLIVKAQGRPTLVPESDKRPAIGVAQAVADFSKE